MKYFIPLQLRRCKFVLCVHWHDIRRYPLMRAAQFNFVYCAFDSYSYSSSYCTLPLDFLALQSWWILHSDDVFQFVCEILAYILGGVMTASWIWIAIVMWIPQEISQQTPLVQMNPVKIYSHMHYNFLASVNFQLDMVHSVQKAIVYCALHVLSYAVNLC